jgi:hypothetical protein
MPRADFLRAALVEIADSKSLTATPTQFYQHLQRVACRALTADAHAEQDSDIGDALRDIASLSARLEAAERDAANLREELKQCQRSR